MTEVNHLTHKEQIVLIAVLGLFLVGLAVKTWRHFDAPPAATEVTGN